MNSVNMIGRLTRDVELNYLQDGRAASKTSIAINEYYYDQTGNKQEITTYVDLQFYGRLAEVANQFLSTGKQAGISGKLRRDNWVSQDGQKKYRYYILVEKLDLLNSNTGHSSKKTEKTEKTKKEFNPYIIPEIEIDEDEIPF